ncbi:hypothetical protein K490DRAFT_61850 [Saccharata proteae CBS 121410]|uniref:Uncharacterized protein n=1 Tax=Saccharata proteae CBS 121410 TaxID=1314787 RepID=A0A9P4HWK8_9PEZI|nr:hypothetical protein K490DRAFT_61850 [Saccharata proteae CBS 121410]
MTYPGNSQNYPRSRPQRPQTESRTPVRGITVAQGMMPPGLPPNRPLPPTPPPTRPLPPIPSASRSKTTPTPPPKRNPPNLNRTHLLTHLRYADPEKNQRRTTARCDVCFHSINHPPPHLAPDPTPPAIVWLPCPDLHYCHRECLLDSLARADDAKGGDHAGLGGWWNECCPVWNCRVRIVRRVGLGEGGVGGGREGSVGSKASTASMASTGSKASTASTGSRRSFRESLKRVFGGRRGSGGSVVSRGSR